MRFQLTFLTGNLSINATEFEIMTASGKILYIKMIRDGICKGIEITSNEKQ
jgi:hypothetical protein